MITTIRDFRECDRPVQPDQVTAEMLDSIRQAADQSRLPQCVWPSIWYGARYQGIDALLVSVAMPLPWESPTDAAPGTASMVTVLPAGYHNRADTYSPTVQPLSR